MRQFKNLKKPTRKKGDTRLWRQLPGNPNYYVSDTGDIWSAGYGKVMCQWLKKSSKDMVVKICNKEELVSRLVAKTWMADFRDDLCVVHLDMNVRNNDLSNLKLMSKSEASRYTSFHNSPSRRGVVLMVGKGTKVFSSLKSAEKYTGINRTTISEICNGTISRTKYKEEFMYLDDYKEMMGLDG